MKKKISVLAAVLLAIGLTACGNNESQVSADTTQNIQADSFEKTETANNFEEAERVLVGRRTPHHGYICRELWL